MASCLLVKLILLAVIYQGGCNWWPYPLPKDCLPEKYPYVPGDTGVICRDCERHGRSEFDLQTLPNTTTRLTVLDCPLKTLIAGQFVNFTGLTYLHLEDVELTKIEVGAFDFIEFIDTVHIVKNYRLKHLQKDVFKGLDNITSLDISENNIETIDVNVFKKMKNLKNLTIASNKLNLDTFSPELIKGLNLTYIDISDNPFDQIPNEVLGELVNLQILIFHQAKKVKHLHIGGEFMNLTQLDTFNVTEIGGDYNESYYLPSNYFYNLSNCPVVHLDLNGNNIYNVENDTFQYLTKLRYLNMNLNSLGFDAIRNVFLGIRVKFLGGFSITDNLVPEFTIKYSLFDGLRLNNIVLGDLNAVNANIIHIEDNSFDGTKIVGYLRFQVNHLNKIGPKTFEGLDNLNGLILMSNRIKDIDGSFTPLKNMTYLDLCENLISNISHNEWNFVQNVETIWLAYNEIDTVPRDSFTGLPNLQYLNFYSNKMDNITPGGFNGLENLETLILAHSLVTQISNKTLGMLPSLIYLSFEECQYMTYIEEAALKELPSLQILSFQDNTELVIDVMMFQNLSNLHTLQLDHVTKMELYVVVNATSFEGTPIENLFISGLNISHFPVSLYDKNLTRLDISYNNIHHVDHRIVVKYLYRYNRLKVFQADHNPYICTCRLGDFVRWLNVSYWKRDMETGAEDEYICISPEPFENRSIFELDKSRYMCFVHYTPIALYLLYDPFIYQMVYFTAITLFSLIVRYKMTLYYHLRKIIFVMKPNKKKPYEYDAYISYSNADYLFVEKELSEELDTEVIDEKERFKLAIRDRDFRPGTNVDNIDECMKKSRKLVFILSDSFLQNKDPLEFCTLEMNIALQTVDDADFSRIIIIQKGYLTESLPPLVDAMVRERVCLEWPEDQRQQKKFWKHLRRELRSPKTSKKAKMMQKERDLEVSVP